MEADPTAIHKKVRDRYSRNSDGIIAKTNTEIVLKDHFKSLRTSLLSCHGRVAMANKATPPNSANRTY